MKKILIVDLITLMSVTVDKNFYGYNTMSTGLEIKKCIGIGTYFSAAVFKRYLTVLKDYNLRI